MFHSINNHISFNMEKNPQIILVKDIFSKENSNQFLVELDVALKTIDYHQIEQLLIRYNIQQDPECITFLETIQSIFENWKKEGCGSTLVDNIETRITKCYACFLGKNVKAYEFNYQHKDKPGIESNYVYASEFAIYTEIENNCLVDFGVCNGFLSKTEIKYVF